MADGDDDDDDISQSRLDFGGDVRDGSNFASVGRPERLAGHDVDSV